MTFTKKHLNETILIINQLDHDLIENSIKLIEGVRKNAGRIFFLGVGGSAGNASHAVNDFRKIVGIESYSPSDNVSELTARINDDGWSNVYSDWLEVSNLNSLDMVFILSVGGGDLEKNISPNIVNGIIYAKKKNAKVISIVGRNKGFAAQNSDICILIPVVNSEAITPHSEAFQSVILHLIVSHPILKAKETKWESCEPKK